MHHLTDIILSTGLSSSTPTNSSKSVPQPMIRAKNLSELQNKRPEGSAVSATCSEERRSPEVICLGEAKNMNPAKNQYSVVAGQPVIKFTPTPMQMEGVVLEEAMPKNIPNADSQVLPAVIKQCARKSICRGNVTLFPGQNGVSIEETTGKPQPQLPNVNLASTMKTGNAVPWKIENPRSIVKAVAPQRTEPTRKSKDHEGRSGSQKATIKAATPQQAEPTRKSKDTDGRLESSKTSIQQKVEHARNEASKSPTNPESLKPATPAILTKPAPEDDEIQIIMEVPGTSAKTVATSTKATSQESRNQETSEDQPAPPKKPRLSTNEPFIATPKRKIDKDRELSANQHFLLSLLYDVESLNKTQFRRLKKHTAALVCLILDPR